MKIGKLIAKPDGAREDRGDTVAESVSLLGRWYELAGSEATDPVPGDIQALRVRHVADVLLLATVMSVLALAVWGLTAVVSHSVAIGTLSVIITALVLDAGVLFLNRRGTVGAAGILLVIVADMPTVGALLSSPSLTVDWPQLFSLYTLIIAVFVAAFLLSTRSAMITGGVNAVLLVAAVLGLPHAHAVASYEMSVAGMAAVLGLPLCVLTVSALITVGWSKEMAVAVARAADAEQSADLAWHDAQRSRDEVDRRQSLDDSVRQIAHALNQLAEGQERVRAIPARPGEAMMVTNMRAALTTLSTRMESLLRAEATLQRERQEVARLTENLKALRNGQDVNWPVTANVPLDDVNYLLANDRRLLTPSQPGTSAPSGWMAPDRGTVPLPESDRYPSPPPYEQSAPLSEMQVQSGPIVSGTLYRPDIDTLIDRLQSGPMQNWGSGSPDAPNGTGAGRGSGPLLSRLQSGPLPPRDTTGSLREPVAPWDFSEPAESVPGGPENDD